MAGGTWSEGKLLAFDLETTGVDRFVDVPVAFALVSVEHGAVVECRASLVDPGRDIPAGATAVHGITTERARAEGVPLDQAITMMASELVGASRNGIPVVGMKLDYDLTIVDAQHRRLAGRGLVDLGFGGPVLDALVLDRHFDRYRKGRRRLEDLCAEYRVVIENAHDAAADALASLRVLGAMCARYPDLDGARPAELHHQQAAWHKEWVQSFGAWRAGRGLPPLDPHEACWPIAPCGSEVPAGARTSMLA